MHSPGWRLLPSCTVKLRLSPLSELPDVLFQQHDRIENPAIFNDPVNVSCMADIL